MTNDGALAQLGERLHGMQEVSGSIPLGSTIILYPKKFRATAPACATSDTWFTLSLWPRVIATSRDCARRSLLGLNVANSFSKWSVILKVCISVTFYT